MAVAPENGLVRFGVFELDTKAGQLSKNGIRVRLSQQPLQVLSVLVEPGARSFPARISTSFSGPQTSLSTLTTVSTSPFRNFAMR